jgi:hypothetical protein
MSNVEHNVGSSIVQGQCAQVIDAHIKMNKSRPFKEYSVKTEVPKLRSVSFIQMDRGTSGITKKWNKIKRSKDVPRYLLNK